MLDSPVRYLQQLTAAVTVSLLSPLNHLSIAPVRAATPSVITAQATTGICPAQLAGSLNAIANRSQSQVRWGVMVQTLGDRASRKTLFARNAETLLIPASNNKLLTTAAALKALGPQYRIRTAVYGDSSQPTLATLRIVGHGDPSLTTAQLTTLAQQLRQKGIRQVAQLIGDDTYFRGASVNPYWDRGDTLAGYGAAVNSLLLNQNAIGLTLIPQRVGQALRVQWDEPAEASTWQVENRSITVSASQGEYVDAVRDSTERVIRISGQLRAGSASEPIAVSVPNPGNYLVQKFRTALTAAGITVQRSTLVAATPAPPGLIELAAVESPPLAQLLVETNQESNNIYAEALLKTIGRVQTPTSLNATESGIAAVKAILTPLGVNPSRYSTVDGSGLADRNRVSPEVFVQTLQAIAQLPDAQVYRQSLPVAGVSGTLKNRFRNTAAQGILAAKTGTISGVVALSGYLTPRNHPPIVLSILANSTGSSDSAMRSTVDEMVLVLTRLRSC